MSQIKAKAPHFFSMTKKTRDLPNLTECHCCHLRVDLAKSKNKLQILYSEWRIVLLCTQCLARVESTELCSYCFTASSSGYCFSCRQCKRRVHRHCDSDHRSSAAWSGSSSLAAAASAAEEVSICGDCWVSESLARWRRSRTNNMSCVRPKEAAEVGFERSRVSDKPSSTRQEAECFDRLEDVVEDDDEDDGALKEGQGSCSNGVELEASSPLEDCDWRPKVETCNARLDPYYFKYRRRRRSGGQCLLTYKRRGIVECCKRLRKVEECGLLTYKRRGSVDHRFMFTYRKRRSFDQCVLTYKRRRPGIIFASTKEEEARSSIDYCLLTYKRRSIVDCCRSLNNIDFPLLTYKRRGHHFMFTYKRRGNFDQCMLTYKRRKPGIL